jgi:hypothetical protein
MGRGAGMRDVVKLLLRPVSVLSLGLSTMGMMGTWSVFDQKDERSGAGRQSRQGVFRIMKRISITGLALVAMSVIGAFSASSAFANCELTLGYCILGVPLGAGETRLILAKVHPGSEFVLKGEAFAIKSVTKCKKLKLSTAGQDPVIVGGMPGTGSGQLVVFEECSATLGGTACTSVKVENTPTLTEQVMVLKPASRKGALATLFRPTNGTNFTTIKLTSCGGLGSQEAAVTGTTAAYDVPVLTEGLTGLLEYKEGAEEITEVEKSGGAKEPVGLKFGGKAATLNGIADVWLENDELWGVGL